MRFKEFRETCARKCVLAECSDQTQLYLMDWCMQHGFDLTKSYSGDEINPLDFGFHTTVMFSTSSHCLPNINMEIGEFDLQPVKFSVLGENTPVLEVFSPKLLQLRDVYENQHDMKSSYPDYKPHISLSYNWSGSVEDFTRMPFPGGLGERLTVDRLVMSDIKEQ